MNTSIADFALQILLEVQNSGQWTLPEWLSVIGGVGTIVVVGRWVAQRLNSMIRVFLSHSGRLSQKLMVAGISSEHKSILNIMELSFAFESHPSLSVIFIARIFTKILLALTIGAIVFIGAPGSLSIVLSTFILVLIVFVLIILSRELKFLMYAENRIKKFQTRFKKTIPLLKNMDADTAIYIDEIASHLDELIEIARRIDFRRWDPSNSETSIQNKLDEKRAEADSKTDG